MVPSSSSVAIRRATIVCTGVLSVMVMGETGRSEGAWSFPSNKFTRNYVSGEEWERSKEEKERGKREEESGRTRYVRVGGRREGEEDEGEREKRRKERGRRG